MPLIVKLDANESEKDVLPIHERTPIVITEPICKPPVKWSIHRYPVNIGEGVSPKELTIISILQIFAILLSILPQN